MFNKQQERGTVLGVCVTPASFNGRSGALEFRAVHSARRAIDMLRLVRCDLLLVNLNLPDMCIWNFLRHVKTNWPQQKWALVGGPLSAQQEIMARMFNVFTIFNAPPSIDEVCKWQTLSDVLTSAQGEPTFVATADSIDPRNDETGTVFGRSKQTSPFEITRLAGAYDTAASYVKKSSVGAV
jgi:CheY-like chemotaxis protein